MWGILRWAFEAPKEQEKPSTDAKLHELCTPSVPYAERPAGHPQYCGEAAVEYGTSLRFCESNVLSVSSLFMASTPIRKQDGHESSLMGLGIHG
jgi:hypothetical protein